MTGELERGGPVDPILYTPTVRRARAYVLRGHWVADCPANCGQTQWVFRGHVNHEGFPCHCVGGNATREPQWYCRNCHLIAEIEWPPGSAMDDIMEVLLLRPNPVNRNWYPAGHDIALRFNLPHGQTPADLREENEENGVRAQKGGGSN